MNRKQYISEIFNNKEKIEDYQLEYFYTKYPNMCCDFKDIKPFFDDIKPFGYYGLAVKIGDMYKDIEHNTFIGDFLKNIKELDLNKNNYKDTLNIKLDDIYLNYLMVYYVQSRPNIKILTRWPNCELKPEEIESKITGNFYAKKEIKISGNASLSLLYQMYGYTNNHKKVKELESYSKGLGCVSLEDFKELHIYVYEDEPIEIPGTHTTKTFMEAMTVSKIYFNKNSIYYLEKQVIDRMLSFKFRKCIILFNTFINYLFQNIYLFDINKFLVLSGSILYTFGVRACSDVDFFIGNSPKEIKTPNFLEKIEKFFLNEKTKFFFTDGYTKLIDPKLYWNDFWEEWHYRWAELFGAEHMSETIFNPKYHYYFMGVKMLYLDADLARRNVRGRPAAVADLLKANELLGLDVKIKPVPKETIKLGVITKTTPDKFLDIVKYWLKRRYQTNVTVDELKELVNFE